MFTIQLDQDRLPFRAPAQRGPIMVRLSLFPRPGGGGRRGRRACAEGARPTSWNLACGYARIRLRVFHVCVWVFLVFILSACCVMCVMHECACTIRWHGVQANALWT